MEFALNAGNWKRYKHLLSDERRKRLETVSARRSSHIHVVIQDIHHPHNVSACLRSAEAFGLSGVGVVTLREKFKASEVARGVTRWLKIDRFLDISSCAQSLKARGYRIAVGFPSADARPLNELPVEEPLALVFANEHAGADKEWQEHLDYRFVIPMQGFVESLNISVSCAVSLYETTKRARETLGEEHYFLSPAAQEALLDEWMIEEQPRLALGAKTPTSF